MFVAIAFAPVHDHPDATDNISRPRAVPPAKRFSWLIACTIIGVVGLTFNIAGYPLLDPDEGRNAEIAREMAERGDYVLPHLNGVPYLDKPVLYYAAGALSMKLLGPTVLAARLPSLLFVVATIALVAWFGWTIFGATGAWIAALATAATPFTVAYARTVIFDSTLTFFVTAAIVGFYISTDRLERESGIGQSQWWTALAWAAMAFGVLTKGPIALVLPLMVATPFVAWRRRWRALADPVAVLLFVALVAPWVFVVSREVPDFLRYVLVTETINRLTTDELRRTGPFWYFLVILPVATLPWSLAAIGSGREALRRRSTTSTLDKRIAFLLLWIAIPLLFFTFSQSKRPQYVLPLVPAVALLVAGLWRDTRVILWGARVAGGGLVTVGIFLLAANRLLPRLVPATDRVAAAIPDTALMLGSACVACGIGAWLWSRQWQRLLLVLSLPVTLIPMTSTQLMDAIGKERSAEDIARAIEAAAGPGVRVIGVAALPLSLPFYLRREIILATADGSELTSNYAVRNWDAIGRDVPSVRDADWWKDELLDCDRPTVFIASAANLQARNLLASGLDLLISSDKYVAFGPCGMTTLVRLPP